MSRSPLPAILVVALLATPALAAPIIVNPGFETPAIGMNSFQYVPTFGGLTGITGWTFGVAAGASYDGYVNGSTIVNGAVPPEGAQAAFVQGTGSIFQSISGFAAGTYILQLKAASRTGGYGPQPLIVTLDSTTLTFGGGGTLAPAATSYQGFMSDPFVVTAGSHTLTFTGTIPFPTQDKMTLLDGLSFTAPPAIIQTNATASPSQIAFPVSSVDLINQGQPTLAGVASIHYTGSGGSNVAAMNDGSAGNPSDNNTIAFDYNDASPGAWTTTYTLNTSLNPLGYDITRIETVSGWNDSRAGQDYTLLYNTVLDPTFVPLGTYRLDMTNGSSRITLTNPTGGAFASGVMSLRFDFAPGQTEDVYREIDVFGTATLPEPATLTLLALGGLGLLRRRGRGSLKVSGRGPRSA